MWAMTVVIPKAPIKRTVLHIISQLLCVGSSAKQAGVLHGGRVHLAGRE